MTNVDTLMRNGIRKKAYLQRTHYKHWWSSAEYEFEEVTIIGVGARWEQEDGCYYTILIKNKSGVLEGVHSTDLYTL